MLSLYRRHRPRSFDQVVGQEHIVRTLRNAIELGKVHHAYLFVGSRGTGKTSMAKLLACALIEARSCERFSLLAGVVSSLLNDNARPDYVANIRAEYAKVAENHAKADRNKTRVKLEDARANAFKASFAGYAPPVPTFTGTRAFEAWTSVLVTWGRTLSGEALLDAIVTRAFTAPVSSQSLSLAR